MIKRNWKGQPDCFFCDQAETVNHLLFNCYVARTVWATIATCLGASDIPVNTSQIWRWCEKWIPGCRQFYAVGIAAIFWVIWKCRNKMCFDGKVLKNPIEIICHACALMRFWAGLQKDEDKEKLIQGVNNMLRIATRLLTKSQSDAARPPMLRDKEKTKMLSRIRRSEGLRSAGGSLFWVFWLSSCFLALCWPASLC